MKNKLYTILLILIIPILGYSQEYSNYYLNANVNSNINAKVTHNVSGVVYENKTITTIDYGALELANAQILRLAEEGVIGSLITDLRGE